ncbi:hypothetical protein GH714_040510 [Hevea brasiliensis]|uniref:Leucine-rich repeat-containing N-terminal plant-type domain-containing protein n=1 Tax=Hevea brasiliensis TaxID=3981 RepID=A0A6A6L8B0_HEVBR|nr:hypothetical protein GH714_040510 [Hevea brasiliensis]
MMRSCNLGPSFPGRIPLPSNQTAVLDLSNNKFSGPIPETVGDISFFILSLASNQIISAIPTSVGRMQTVHVIDLSRNNLTGRIPKSIGNCGFLQILDLQNNYLTGRIPSSLGQLTHLQTIHLRDNMITGRLPSSFKNLSRLKTLDLGCNRLTGIHNGNAQLVDCLDSDREALIDFKEDLSFNKFFAEFPNWLVNISSLVYVDIRYSQLHGSIPLALSMLPILQFLHVEFNHLKANSSPLFQGSWKNLEVLNLGINIIYGEFTQILEGTDDCLSKSPVPSLQYLLLRRSRLVGKLLTWLGQIQNLVERCLNYNLFHGPIPDLGALRCLATLLLGKNELNGTLSDTLFQLPKLSILDVSDNQLTESLPYSLAWVSMLSVLDVSFNCLTGLQSLDMASFLLGPSFPAWLKYQSNLSYLDFSNASLSGSIPSWFWDISGGLNSLNLSFNQLKGQLPNPLNLQEVAFLDLSSNLFEGPIPLLLAGIQVLDLSDNRFSGLIAKMISGFTQFWIFLSFAGNQLIGEIPDSIGQTFSSIIIDLSRNNLSGSIPSNMANCRQLQVLDIQNNYQERHWMTGNIPSWFGHGFQNLRILRLRSNTFSGELPSSLSSLGSLQILDLAENELEGDYPTSAGTAECAIADGYSVDKWFYLAVGLGFAAGILVPCFILIVQRTWSDVCFSFVDKTANGLLYWGQETTAFFKTGGDHNP